MRSYFMVATTMLLAGCLATFDETSQDDEIDVGTDSQAVIEPHTELVLESWSQVQALESRDPVLYQQALSPLEEAGVDCTDVDGSSGRCIGLDEVTAEVMMQQGTLECDTYCYPSPKGSPTPITCRRNCCIKVIFTACGWEHEWETY